MPNKCSHASHTPIRTCVICRSKQPQEQLLSFIMLREGLVMDLGRKLHSRKSYICPQTDCLKGIDKWSRRFKKKSYGKIKEAS